MPKTVNWQHKRVEWINCLSELCGAIRQWAEQQGWSVDQQEKEVKEEHLGAYVAPYLIIKAPSGTIHVEPVGRNIIGADGRVDILSFPSLNRMLLVRINDNWHIKTDSRVDWPEPWNKETFIHLVEALGSEQ